MIRASGTLADPNKLGAVAAFWTIGTVVLARRMARPWSTVVTTSALAIGVGAVWLCGLLTNRPCRGFGQHGDRHRGRFGALAIHCERRLAST